jgi:Tol biopolymer transport system component
LALAPGTRLGVYEIVAQIGEGGMGQVYRATDTKLKRQVAIKTLPPSFAEDAERLARFQQEAEVLAALNHPGIATIYGFEQSNGVHALVMELVEGDDLSDRIARGTISVHEALAIARQLADALQAAHEQRIIHRDLKPANIKVRADGRVKVLDFGLAKPIAIAGVAGDAAQSTAVGTPPQTEVGKILGTIAYMSPEQARGRPLDERTDVWAFGCVLYEMLAGRRAFAGADVADTLSRVLQREPDGALLPDTIPPAVRRLLARCFEKDQNKRFSQIAAAAFLIDDVLSESSSGTVAAVPIRSGRRIGPLVAALAAGAILGAVIAWLAIPRPAVFTAPVTRLQMSVAPADELGGIAGRPTRTAFALSPDGRTVVFSGAQKNQRALYARPFDQPAATVIPGTDGAVAPFFSPDGQWIGFWSPTEIRKVPLGGGPPVRIVAASQIFGASWGEDGNIVFARGTGGLIEVPAAGGSARELTTLNVERGEVSHRLPQVLPGGDAVIFTVTHNRFTRWDETEIWLYSRSGRVYKPLITGGADARYIPSGHLLYVREGALLAVAFDLKTLEVSGGPVGVVPDVMQAAYVAGQPNDSGAMQASVSASGTLVYVNGGLHPPTEYSVMQLDRTGRGAALPIPPQDFRTLRLSPGSTRLALATVGRDRSTWVYDFARGALSQLAGAGRSSTPVWTPDGERITYGGGTKGPNNLHWIRADGGGAAERLFESPTNFEAGGWTPNGRELLYYEIPSDAVMVQQIGPILWAQDVIGKTPPRKIVGPFAATGGVDVSPDGRWIAYHSGALGRLEVYVDAYPGPGPRFQVSSNGGGSPVWRADGRELFYARASAGGPARGNVAVDIMSVAVTTQPTVSFGVARQLFSGQFSMNAPARGWDVSGDGQRFILLQPRARPADVINEMTVVENWIEELNRLVPAR